MRMTNFAFAGLSLPKVRTGRVVHDNKTPVRQSSDGMSNVGGHNGNDAGLRNLSFSVDGQFKFTLDHFINLFLPVKVLMNLGTGCELVMCERHARRVNITPLPSR